VQREAGFEPNCLQPAYEDAYLFEKLVALTREHGRFPTHREVLTKTYNDDDFPSPTAFRRLGDKKTLITKLVGYCTAHPRHADVGALLKPLVSHVGKSHRRSPPKRHEYGFVYLVEGHPGEYKIGRTNLVDRRLAQLGAKAAVEPRLVHEIKTDDPSGVEAYWHRRYRDKRMRGEWFRLSASEVKVFKRWRRIY